MNKNRTEPQIEGDADTGGFESGTDECKFNSNFINAKYSYQIVFYP